MWKERAATRWFPKSVREYALRMAPVHCFRSHDGLVLTILSVSIALTFAIYEITWLFPATCSSAHSLYLRHCPKHCPKPIRPGTDVYSRFSLICSIHLYVAVWFLLQVCDFHLSGWFRELKGQPRDPHMVGTVWDFVDGFPDSYINDINHSKRFLLCWVALSWSLDCTL